MTRQEPQLKPPGRRGSYQMLICPLL